MSSHNQNIGALGEQIAADYITETLAMTVVERNWRSRSKELDIIAIKDYDLRIIEVKSRLEQSQESISNSLNSTKLKNLTQGAALYIAANNHNGLNEVYFDLVTIIFNEDGSHKIEYIPRFFTPSW